MSSLNKTFLRTAGMLAGAFVFALNPACKQPPTPAYHGEDAGNAIGIRYASFYMKTEDDFKRISEYFTNEENTGSHAVVRSRPEARDGLYMIVSLESGAVVPAGSVAELRYYHPKKSGLQACRWELPEFNAAAHRELRLGLTGEDWDSSLSRKRPSAWQLNVFAPDGQLLFRRNSYLWK